MWQGEQTKKWGDCFNCRQSLHVSDKNAQIVFSQKKQLLLSLDLPSSYNFVVLCVFGQQKCLSSFSFDQQQVIA